MQKAVVSVALDPEDVAKLHAMRREREVIPTLSAVAREVLKRGLVGGGVPAQRAPFVPPALDLSAEDLGHARREVREEGIMTATPGEALLKFYDEVMAMTGHAPAASPPPVAQVVPFRGAVSR